MSNSLQQTAERNADCDDKSTAQKFLSRFPFHHEAKRSNHFHWLISKATKLASWHRYRQKKVLKASQGFYGQGCDAGDIQAPDFCLRKPPDHPYLPASSKND